MEMETKWMMMMTNNWMKTNCRSWSSSWRRRRNSITGSRVGEAGSDHSSCSCPITMGRFSYRSIPILMIVIILISGMVVALLKVPMVQHPPVPGKSAGSNETTTQTMLQSSTITPEKMARTTSSVHSENNKQP